MLPIYGINEPEKFDDQESEMITMEMELGESVALEAAALKRFIEPDFDNLEVLDFSESLSDFAKLEKHFENYARKALQSTNDKIRLMPKWEGMVS